MPNIGVPELIILLVVVLIIFGPGKLPDIGNAIGRGVREFRKASSDLEDSIRGETTPAQPGNGGAPSSTTGTPGSAGSAEPE